MNLEDLNLVELNAQEVTEIDGGKNWFQKNWDSAVRDVLHPIRDETRNTLDSIGDYLSGGGRR
jgi:DNA-binding cell septation regulator SpoVG